MIRVLVVYQHLPHYRYGVFKALESLPNATYEFAGDTTSRDGSIPTIPTDELRSFHRLRNAWAGRVLWQRGLLGLIWRGGYDAVVFLGDASYASSWFAAFLSRLRGSKVLYWTIGWHRTEHGVVKVARMAFYRLAHKLLLYGEGARGIGTKMGFPVDRMAIIGNSHHPMRSERALAPQELEAFAKRIHTDSTRVVGAIVRLNAVKRLDLLIKAAADLKERGRGVAVLLVGAGPELENLQSLARDLEVEAVFAGAAYAEEEIDLFYRRAAVTVVPVNAGLTALQSLRYGRPVITSDNPFKQAPESECIRPGVTGDYYRDGSVSDLAAKIDSWVEAVQKSPGDVARRCRAELAARWTPDAQATAIHHEVVSVVSMSTIQ